MADRERRELPPGTAIPPEWDQEEIEVQRKEEAKASELLIRGRTDPTQPWSAEPPRWNPNHPLGAVLAPIGGNIGTLEILLAMLVSQQAGYEIGIGEVGPKPEGRPAGGPVGPVRGGGVETGGERGATTGPSATGGTTTTTDEDAEAAAGQNPEQRERARRAAREQERKK